MELTPDQRVQVLCAVTQGILHTMQKQIEDAPGKIAEKAVTLTKQIIAEVAKNPLF